MGFILDKDLDYLIELYNEKFDLNLKSIEKILTADINLDEPSLMKLFHAYFMRSKNKLIEKWKSGKKSLRTFTVVKAFPKEYIKSIKSILLIDAIINILDDLIDENLEDKEKKFYIVELLRVMAEHQIIASTEEERKLLSTYLVKCITIAILEKFYYSLIKDLEPYDEILSFSNIIYDTRSLDMDIFIQIPLLGKDDMPKDDIVIVGRAYRALELLKKDILDFEHDIDHEIDTIFTLYRDKKGLLRNLVNDISSSYLLKAREVAASNPSDVIVNNFISMIESEVREIEVQVTSLTSDL